jgi:hypothetical protein
MYIIKFEKKHSIYNYNMLCFHGYSGSLESGLEQLLKQSEGSLLSLKIVDCSNILTEK